MAATIAGAIEPLLTPLGVTVWRDEAPEGTVPPLPRVTVVEGIATSARLHGDAGADDAVDELVQVDLWQQWRDPGSGAVTEQYNLADRIVTALHGAALALTGARVYGFRLSSSVRLLERDANVVHHAITFRVSRSLRTV